MTVSDSAGIAGITDYTEPGTPIENQVGYWARNPPGLGQWDSQQKEDAHSGDTGMGEVAQARGTEGMETEAQRMKESWWVGAGG